MNESKKLIFPATLTISGFHTGGPSPVEADLCVPCLQKLRAEFFGVPVETADTVGGGGRGVPPRPARDASSPRAGQRLARHNGVSQRTASVLGLLVLLIAIAVAIALWYGEDD